MPSPFDTAPSAPSGQPPRPVDALADTDRPATWCAEPLTESSLTSDREHPSCRRCSGTRYVIAYPPPEATGLARRVRCPACNSEPRSR